MKTIKLVSDTSHIDLTIRELQYEEIHIIIPLLSKLYSSLDKKILKNRLNDISNSNWKCLGLFCNKKLIGLSGYWISTRIYCGKYLYIDHFIIDANYRYKGLGEKFLDHIKKLAIASNCEQVCLDTFLANNLAQSFWSKHGFKTIGFHYVYNSRVV